MARPFETKKLAARIDARYIRHPDSRVTLLRVVGVMVSVAAVLWWLGGVTEWARVRTCGGVSAVSGATV